MGGEERYGMRSAGREDKKDRKKGVSRPCWWAAVKSMLKEWEPQNGQWRKGVEG